MISKTLVANVAERCHPEFVPSKAWNDVVRLYKLGDKLGQGSFGEVVAATCRFTRDKVAIKHVSLYYYTTDYEIIKNIREIMINQGMLKCTIGQKSTFFPKLVDIIVPSEQEAYDLQDIFLVFEKEPMDLRSYILAQNKEDFGEEEIKKILYSILCSLNFIHTANIVHRDLKPANILINEKL